MAVAFVAVIVIVVFGAMKSSDAYKLAVARAKADPRVTAALGTPISEGMFLSGNTNVNGATGEANLAIPISGPKGKATIYAEATKSAGYLSEELAARVAANPVRFTWYAQIAEDSDVIDDPATSWPDDRQRVPLGHIVIDQVGPNSPEADRSLAFMPGSLPPGIEFADPMLTIRNASYPHSFQERNS